MSMTEAPVGRAVEKGVMLGPETAYLHGGEGPYEWDGVMYPSKDEHEDGRYALYTTELPA